ncbi:MAG TPA: hypothetical protein DIW47_01745 [Bacteroidetes bacterium]|nr:hypothetical protein [Bacteroidota bacterium]
MNKSFYLLIIFFFACSAKNEQTNQTHSLTDSVNENKDQIDYVYPDDSLIFDDPSSRIQKDTLIRVKANTLYNKEFWWAIKQGKWGILDAAKKEVVPCEYTMPFVVGKYYSRERGEGCEFYTSNPVIMLKDSGAALVDLQKGVISPPNTNYLRSINSFFVFKAGNNKYGLLDKTGRTLIPPISEKCIYKVFDSLLLLYYNGNFCYHDFENKVVKQPGQFHEQDYRDVINDFIVNGVFKDHFRFQFHTSTIAREHLIPALIYFEENYKETKFIGLKNMLDGLLDTTMDYCYVEGCFRYLAEFLAYSSTSYQVDLDCDKNVFTNFDTPFNSIKGLGNGVVEYRNAELSASEFYVYHHISHFQYCRINGNTAEKLQFSDFFTPQNKALAKINTYIDSLKNLAEDETFNLITPENLTITENSTFSLDEDGITFWLFYLNYEKIGSGEDQFEVHIPYSYLEAFIPENELVAGIREHFGVEE